MSGPKILTLDIETAPAQVYVWDIFRPIIGIDQIISPTRVICLAAKWHHEKRVRFLAEWDHIDFIEHTRDLLDEADIVVTYNGNNFDIPHLNREFDAYGLAHPSPFHSVDLYRAVKKRERHLSHKLAWVSQQKAIAEKADSGGFQTWLDLASEDEKVRAKAQRKMKAYNIQDVRTTEQLFDNMLPHLSLPNFALYSEEVDGALLCPAGHERFKKDGWKVTRTRRYQQYQCLDCGRYFSDTRSSGSVGTT